jgi:hypothetical protein
MLPDYYCRLPLAKDEVNKCSLKVYLAWSGTDRYDTALESSNMMFSKVRAGRPPRPPPVLPCVSSAPPAPHDCQRVRER